MCRACLNFYILRPRLGSFRFTNGLQTSVFANHSVLEKEHHGGGSGILGLMPDTLKFMIWLACRTGSVRGAIRHSGKLEGKPYFLVLQMRTHALFASRFCGSCLPNRSKSNDFLPSALLPSPPPLGVVPSVSQLFSLLQPLTLFKFFATWQLRNPEVRSQYPSAANPTSLKGKRNVFTMTRKVVSHSPHAHLL